MKHMVIAPATLSDESPKSLTQLSAYHKWLKAEILEAIDDPRPGIPDEDVKRHFAVMREALRNRIAAMARFGHIE